MLAHQVGEEEHGALEHADHEQVAPLVVAADLGAELGDAPLQVLLETRVSPIGSPSALTARSLRRAGGDQSGAVGLHRRA